MSYYQSDEVKFKIKLSLCLIEHAIKTSGSGMEVWLHVFITSVLDAAEWYHVPAVLPQPIG
jgi:hypothetical protein